jgi:hypothetical protein
LDEFLKTFLAEDWPSSIFYFSFNAEFLFDVRIKDRWESWPQEMNKHPNPKTCFNPTALQSLFYIPAIKIKSRANYFLKT